MINIDASKLQFIAQVKERIRVAQYNALKSVNTQLVTLYWELGRSISEKQADGWGKAIVPTLAKELQKEFPDMTGFSSTNLWYMVQFYNEYALDINLQPLVGEISWTKHIVILSKCKDKQERHFYILSTKKFGWTKDVLLHQIENRCYEKYLLNQTNFDITLSESIKKQASLAVKDQYTFDFLELSKEHSEFQLEQAILQNIRLFLMELGTDYTFVGSQYKLYVNNREFRVDLLLYHRRLQSLVAIDLKIGEFEPEHKGKIEFYLSLLNEQIRLPHENPAIGIIICKSKDRTIVEYSLRNAVQPIGVATYSTTGVLPAEYIEMLPSVDEIKDKLQEFLEKGGG